MPRLGSCCVSRADFVKEDDGIARALASLGLRHGFHGSRPRYCRKEQEQFYKCPFEGLVSTTVLLYYYRAIDVLLGFGPSIATPGISSGSNPRLEQLVRTLIDPRPLDFMPIFKLHGTVILPSRRGRAHSLSHNSRPAHCQDLAEGHVRHLGRSPCSPRRCQGAICKLHSQLSNEFYLQGISQSSLQAMGKAWRAT